MTIVPATDPGLLAAQAVAPEGWEFLGADKNGAEWLVLLAEPAECVGCHTARAFFVVREAFPPLGGSPAGRWSALCVPCSSAHRRQTPAGVGL